MFVLVINADSFTGAFLDHRYKLGIKYVYFIKESATDGSVL